MGPGPSGAFPRSPDKETPPMNRETDPSTLPGPDEPDDGEDQTEDDTEEPAPA